MSAHAVQPGFLSGIIEGFYGPPWAQADRLQLFEWLAAWGLNSYFYCPKDDLKQRAIWRTPYTTGEARVLGELIEACTRHGLHFLYAISPGLDIRYASDADLSHLRERFDQMIGLGARHFALLFDDIPDRLDPADLARWGSLAAAQAHVANSLTQHLRGRIPEARMLFCPTPYCGRMDRAGHGGPGYLDTLGAHLAAGIDILWTGPEIVSREITVEHVRDIAGRLRRKPLIWDNLHANDYDGRRFFCGPYSGRPCELRAEVAGILSNPNCEFPLNYPGFHSFASWLRGDAAWIPRQSYLAALQDWLPRFATTGTPLSLADLTLLSDCHYLPYETGPEAEALFRRIHALLRRPACEWGADAMPLRGEITRLRDLCGRLPELLDRPLFYALGRRVWELREELDLLDRYIAFKLAHPAPDTRCGSDFHLPETFRGSYVARLQQLLRQLPNGDFVPTVSEP